MRNIDRGWRQYFGVDMMNNLEHTMRVVWIALMLARKEGVGDENTIIKMALAHDLAETRTGDHAQVQKVYVKEDETQAAQDLFAGTSIRNYENILHEYKKRTSIEAKIVKDADNLDIDLELKELEERGHRLPEQWVANRRFVRDTKLYTESAKKMWDEIQTSRPGSWSLTKQKWNTIPTAGK